MKQIIKALNKLNKSLLGNKEVLFNCFLSMNQYVITGYAISHYINSSDVMSLYGYNEYNSDIRVVFTGDISIGLEHITVVSTTTNTKSLF